MQPRDSQRLYHILDYCEDVLKHLSVIGNEHDVFLSDTMCQHSIAFCILQIGELVARLSDELRNDTAQEINWSAIKSMRKIVVHDYGNIDLEVVWNVATEDIPVLKSFCESQLNL